MTQFIDPQNVAQYLINHPDFFEKHTDILANLRLAKPSTGKAISLHERQIEVLRKRQKELEQELTRLTIIAQDNKELMEKTISLAVKLLEKRDETDMPQVVIDELKSVFNLSEATLRLWHVREKYAGNWFAKPVAENIIEAVCRMPSPYCGKAEKNVDIVQWFSHPNKIQSVALVPLPEPKSAIPFGLLAIGSLDPDRFRSDMATDFLTAIGKTAGAALARITGTEQK